MNKKILFIADFFVEHVLGGGELNNDELIKMLRSDGHEVLEIQSHKVNETVLLFSYNQNRKKLMLFIY